MAYITVNDVRDHSDEKGLELTADKRLTDQVLTSLIFAVSQWLNHQLKADKVRNEAGQYIYIDFQSADENADSYCTADQLLQIDDIVLYEVVARALVIKEVATTTPRVVQINPLQPTWADDAYNEVRQAKNYSETVKMMISTLIADDAQYGNFKYAQPEESAYGFLKVNQNMSRKSWTQTTVEDVMERIPSK